MPISSAPGGSSAARFVTSEQLADYELVTSRRPSSIDPFTLSASNAATYVATETYDSSDQAVHPSVVYRPDGWNGYKYWMAMTPYPGGADTYENPSILASDDGDTWVVPGGLTNPIDDPGGGDFYPDPDLTFVGDTLWCVYNTGPFYAKYSTDGVTWSSRQTLSVTGSPTGVSPTIAERDGDYYLWFVDTSTNPNGLKVYRSTDGIDGPYSSLGSATFDAVALRDVWHIEVRNVGDQFVAAWTTCLSDTSGTTGNLHVATSTDGVDWVLAPTPVLAPGGIGAWDENSIYRSSLVHLESSGDTVFDLFYSGYDTSNNWHVGRTKVRAAAPKASVGALRRFSTGRWYGPQPFTPSTVTNSAGYLTVVPMWVPETATFDRIGCEVTTNVATAVVRLGIYRSTDKDLPGALVLDAGTVDAASATGAQEITIDQELTPGLYWLAAVSQVAAAGLRTVGSSSIPPVASTAFVGTGATTGMNGYRSTGVTGALPSTGPSGTAISGAYLVKLRVV